MIPSPLQTGLDALRRGDFAAARPHLTRATETEPQGRRPWLPLAQACRKLGDASAETHALASLLAEEPRNILALLLMGERKRDDGDDRAAASFMTAALKQAAATPPPPQLTPLLQRAQAFLAENNARYERHLLAAVDFPDAEPERPTRFRRSLDLLLGRRELHLQQPSMFYFPGLPQRQFYEREEFPWATELEAAVPAIRAELAALTDADGFAPYITGDPNRPRPVANPLLDDPSWSAFYIWRNGALTPEAARVPRTVAALAELPIPRIAGRSPMALFSRLQPGTHIRPHHGMLNTRLICHLPLVVPEGCAMRVGDETRAWRDGELTIFDDSIEHEAWNRGPATRTVLLFEIWRPEVTLDERTQLTRLFEAIDEYGGFPAPTGSDH
ncbi:aspartyl/asparaginyl beta-hydroxylase domain-containing protein [uncultured Sphingomonas sp.]|uniref:aspartyl/asparaginyl beta-hydroxylase domain-containing protein n=1 Tax=uncultured Sphingomonas sp. TaxID=158754 RepID=UPI0035C9E4B6